MCNVLTSWKEIAQYLGKGVRTVQRWEQLFGLPVRRVQGKDHHAILAIPEELDAWLHSARSRAQSGLDALSREVETLRAENALLKRQLGLRGSLQKDGKAFHPDPDLIARSSRLVIETMQARERANAILARSRELLSIHDVRSSSTGNQPRREPGSSVSHPS